MKTTDNTTQPAPMRVKHIMPHFLLVTNSQDIDACLELIGQTAIREECGCLFVEVLDGEYGTVYGCERSMPYLEEPVFAIQ